MSEDQVTGIILSGGRGERMEGRDKGLAIYQSRTLISHCIDGLQPQVDSLLISCNRNLDDYSAYGLPLVTDERKDFQGPLAGVEGSLKQCETGLAMIWPVDSLPVPGGLVNTMRNELLEANADIVYLHQPQKSQYLIALMRAKLRQSLSDYLDKGERKVRDWYAMHESIMCKQFATTVIRNLNTADSLQKN